MNKEHQTGSIPGISVLSGIGFDDQRLRNR